jgi:hypothetical protein
MMEEQRQHILGLVLEYGRQRFKHGVANIRADRNSSPRARKVNRKKSNTAMQEAERLYHEITAALRSAL